MDTNIMSENSNDAFIRQRRNLIIMSFIVISFKVGKLQVGDLDALGARFHVGNQDAITPMMLMLLAYFFWRYYGAFGDSGAWQVLTDKGFDYLKGRTRDLAYERAKDVIKKKKESSNDSLEKSVLDAQLENLSFDDVDSAVNEWLSWTYKFKYNRNIAEKLYTNMPPKLEIVFDGCELARKRVACCWYLFFKRSAFSEYIFPFILAIIAAFEIFNHGPSGKIFSLLHEYCIPLDEH
jgi:hypothetical protein